MIFSNELIYTNQYKNRLSFIGVISRIDLHCLFPPFILSMLVFRFLFFLSLAKSFIHVKRLPRIKVLTQSEDTGVELSFREEVENVIDCCLVRDPTSGKLSAKVDTALLVEKAHLLARR